MRGKIIHYNANDGKGLIAAGESQLAFNISQWSSDSAPSVNQAVDVSTNEDGSPARVALVDTQTLAKEKFRHFAAQGGSQGQEAAIQAKALLGHISRRMGMSVMTVCAILIVAWFLMPALSVNTGYAGKTLSVSDVLGLDLKSGSSFGFWSFLGLVSVLLPWLASWLHARWASFFYGAPLLMVVLAYAHVRWQMHEGVVRAMKQAEALGGPQAKAMMQGMVDQMAARIDKAISYEFGFWVVLLLSLYLAAVGIKQYISSLDAGTNRP